MHPGYQMGQQVGSRLLRMIENHEYADNGYSYVFEPRIYEGRSIRRIGGTERGGRTGGTG